VRRAEVEDVDDVLDDVDRVAADAAGLSTSVRTRPPFPNSPSRAAGSSGASSTVS
jgi:hypothetical protein